MTEAPIVLCKDFPFLATPPDSLTFDWLPFDATILQGDFVVEVKALDTGTVRFVLETSMDAYIQVTLAQQDLNAVNRAVVSITSGLLQLIRFRLFAAGGATARAVVSASLLPRHE